MKPSCRQCLRHLRTPSPLPRFATVSSLSFARSAPLVPSSSAIPAYRTQPPAALSFTRSYAAPRRQQQQLDTVTCPAQPPDNPPEDFEPVEDELREGEKLEMKLTESAVKQIHRAQQHAKDPSLALRLAVESGGCHGYSYKMQVTSKREPDDYLFPAPSPHSAALLIDAASLPLVKGSTIDYATELIGSSFRVVGNPQSKDAGCGCGVSWELKDLD
ncbi:hypothetical protein JCM8547_008766 [Rhodosporidiobolus lusitaniae]